MTGSAAIPDKQASAGVSTPKICAVLVNHDNNADSVRQLEGHFADDPKGFSAIDWRMVYNGQEPAPELAPHLTDVKCIKVENRGYGAAINFGAAGTRAPFILALNADLAPEPGFIAGALQLAERLLQANQRVGVVGLRLLNNDGSPQGSVGTFPSLVRVATGLFRPRATRKYIEPTKLATNSPIWVTGACMLVRRECFEQLGGFDEGFFMYYEDVDFCRRAITAGWEIRFDANVTARHFRPFHARQLTYRMAYLARHGLLRYFWKHRPRWELYAIGLLIHCEYRWRGRAAGWRQVRQMARRFLRDPENFALELPPDC